MTDYVFKVRVKVTGRSLPKGYELQVIQPFKLSLDTQRLNAAAKTEYEKLKGKTSGYSLMSPDMFEIISKP